MKVSDRNAQKGRLDMEEKKIPETPEASPETSAPECECCEGEAKEAKGKKSTREKNKEKKEIADRDARIAALEDKLSEEHESHLRMMAEYDNFRKRAAKEKEAIYTDAVVDTVTKLLPLIDNLDRALDAEKDKESSMYKGVLMVKKQCDEIFASLGVEEIPALGETFDPNLHEAVMHDEDPDKGENEITGVFRKGYKKGTRVLRYSAVKVSN